MGCGRKMDRRYVLVFCLHFLTAFYLVNGHPTIDKNNHQQQEGDTFDAYVGIDLKDEDFDLPKGGVENKYSWENDYYDSYKSEENGEYNDEYNEHSPDGHIDLNYDKEVHKDVKRENHGDFNETDTDEAGVDDGNYTVAIEEETTTLTNLEDQTDEHVTEEVTNEHTTNGIVEEIVTEEKAEEESGITVSADEHTTITGDETNREDGEGDEAIAAPAEEHTTITTATDADDVNLEKGNGEETIVEPPEEGTGIHEEEQPEPTETNDEVKTDEDAIQDRLDGNDSPLGRSSGGVQTHADLTDDTNDDSKISYFPEDVPEGPVVPHKRIVGGTRVDKREEFAYQASLRYASSKAHFCGASIIDDKNILTAAHCVYDDNHRLFAASRLMIVVGDLSVNDPNEHTTIRIVQHIMPHPEYNYKTFQHDIAVLRVESLGDFTPYVNKIDLDKFTPEVGTDCVVSGWGKTSFSGNPSMALMKVTVPILSREDCMTGYGSAVLDGMICAGKMEGGKDACQGDSGGPLVCNNHLAGVVSWGYDCALKNYPGVYTDVAVYYDWIREQQGKSYNTNSSLMLIIITTVIVVVIVVVLFREFFLDIVLDDPTEGESDIGIDARKTGLVANKRETFSYQASLRYKVPNSHFCGATIIDSSHLITAAHCVTNEGKIVDPASLVVVVGDLNILEETDSTEYRTLTNIFTHSEYNQSSFENDIAVIRVSEPFEAWTQDIKPIEIGDKSPAFYTTCVVSGWGAASSPTTPSEFLRYANIPVIEKRTCFDSYSDSIKMGMLCAGFLEKGKDACQGDSGGPLVCDNKLSGVVSWGQRCANEGLPGVYTDVAVYRSWIEEQKTRSKASSIKFDFFAFVSSCVVLKIFHSAF